MKIKIIIPPKVHQSRDLYLLPHVGESNLPYGAGCLVSVLKKHGHTASIKDLTFLDRPVGNWLTALENKKILEDLTQYISGKPDRKIDYFAEELFEQISDDRADVYGFSVLSRLGLPGGLLLAKKIKEKLGKPIVFGGSAFGKFKTQDLLLRTDFLDYTVLGEGEVPLLKFLEYLRGHAHITGVPNLVYKDGDKVLMNEMKFFDINDMSMPDFDGVDMDLYKLKFSMRDHLLRGKLWLPYHVTRGCSQRCSFCNYVLFHPKVQLKSYEKVLSELTQLKEKYQTNLFFFSDSRLNNSYQYLEKFCDLLIENKLGIKWLTLVSVSNMDRNLLQKMKDAGCRTIVWGIESGSDRILKMLNKGYNAAEAGKILQESHAVDIRNIVNLITGLPTETEEDLNQNIKFMKENAPFIFKVRLFAYSFAPGSPMAKHPEKFGIEKIRIAYSSAIGFRRLGFDEIDGLKWEDKVKQRRRFERKLELEASKLNLWPKRQYYFRYNLYWKLKKKLKKLLSRFLEYGHS